MAHWDVEMHSYAGTDIPAYYRAQSMSGLRAQLQSLADERRVGELHFRYELDELDDEALVVHAYFTGHNGRRRRFMRLRRFS